MFDAADTLEPCLAIMAGMIADLTVNPARMRGLANAGYPTATGNDRRLYAIVGRCGCCGVGVHPKGGTVDAPRPVEEDVTRERAADRGPRPARVR